MDVSRIDDVLAAVLRDAAPAWLWPSVGDEDAVLGRVRYHGVAALLGERLRGGAGGPPGLIRAIRDQARRAAMWELRHQQVLTDLLAALAGRGIRPLLFKGTALAYDLYANPVWRLRADTDLLVAAGDLDGTRDVLLGLGFARDLDAGGEVVTQQEGWTHLAGDGSRHAIDLHRRVASGALDVFTYRELVVASRALPRLGAGAFGLGPVHALLVACLHRAKHAHSPYYSDGVGHLGGDRLIWLSDIHLLAAALADEDWRAFTSEARARGLALVCRDGLAAAARRFGTVIPPAVSAALAAGGRAEPVAAYVEAGRLRALALDLVAVEGTADRLRYLRELCLPPAGYMSAEYAAARVTWLPWL